MSEQECAAQSWNPAQWYGHDPGVGQLEVLMLVVEVNERPVAWRESVCLDSEGGHGCAHF